MNMSNNCSIIYDSAITLASGSVEMMKTHNWVFVILAVIGLISIIVAIVNKAFKGVSIIVYILAVPIIIILALINKKKREERINDLKEIGSYVKLKCQ